ncbi:ClpXP protease specificity-enhancing factor SspB [Albimonas sp. CAU 1670]|uniref:SspB family protein n=1 Tax=Albimonas sp. CAU 1670 TaxID=3032599 RepID=UPI0023DA5077|nr:ClpXP protease specificity-enhancing factor SspB [Albimonas sp. CAU 1670]MDF2233053.1 ClpXP protease specificity-enhancing factor SspB [Albimonas sp. CAU 1670]
MTSNPLDYGRLMQRALRSVVHEALAVAVEEGLPGEHHFYISFDTTHPGVDLPDWLKAQYPEELTIVLQHEFWDLAVTSDRFSVGLSFSERPVKLTVPFDAVLTFVDPHAEFGLKFDPHEVDDEDELGELEDGFDDEDDDDPEPTPPSGGKGEVVSLDRFRKG